MRPEGRSGDTYRFSLPAGASQVWLASWSAVPSDTDASSSDHRRLGVAVERIVLIDANIAIDVWHGHAGFIEGFHDDEAAHRWTDGLARLPAALLECFAGPVTLELHLAPSVLAYRVAGSERSNVAA